MLNNSAFIMRICLLWEMIYQVKIKLYHISYSSVLNGFRTMSRVSNSFVSRSDPMQPTRDRNKGEGIHTANPCLPFSSVHNTGAGQIGQDLRNDIGTRTSEREG